MDALKQIVLTLTPSEKRYFVMFARAFKTESGLIKLFELLIHSKEYDEEELRQKTKIKNITEGRSRLRKLIFKVMRSYREDAGIKQQLRDALSDIEFLERKGLKGEAMKEINKAMKLAEKYEEFQFAGVLLVRKVENMDTTEKPEVLLPRLAQMQQQLELISTESANFISVSLLSKYLTCVINSANFTAPEQIQQQYDDIKGRIKGMLGYVKSNQQRIHLLTMHVFCDDKGENWEAYCAETFKLYEQNPELIEQDPFTYDRFLKTYFRNAVNEKEYEQLAADLIERAEYLLVHNPEIKTHNPERIPRMEMKLTNMKLIYCRVNKVWASLPLLENNIKLELARQSKQEDIIRAINVSILVSCLYASGNYDKSVEWANIFYSLPEASFRKPVMNSVRFLGVFALFRLGQLDLSEIKAMNLYKTLIDQKYSDDYHKYLCSILRKLNQWNLKRLGDREEIKQLAENFAALRKCGDSQYANYYNIKPDEMLEELLK